MIPPKVHVINLEDAVFSPNLSRPNMKSSFASNGSSMLLLRQREVVHEGDLRESSLQSVGGLDAAGIVSKRPW